MKGFLAFVIILAGAGGAYYWTQATKKPTTAEPRMHTGTVTAKVPAGTRLPVMLMTKLASGDTKAGETAVFLVTEPIRSPNGHVVIPQGSLVTAKVTKSRAAGALSSLLNEPARLIIEFERLNANGRTAEVATSAQGERQLELTADNTGVPRVAGNFARLWDEPEARQALQELANVVLDGKPASKESSEMLERVAQKLELRSTVDAIREENLDVVARIGSTLASGSTAVATGDILSSAAALQELVGLAGLVSSRLEGIFKGRNVRAYPGTTYEVFLQEDYTVSIPANN
jgi:hypothetical protein